MLAGAEKLEKKDLTNFPKLVLPYNLHRAA